MKNRSFLKGSYLLLSILCSCTSEVEETISNHIEGVNKITVTLPESPLMTNSRTNIEVGNTVKYTWSETDTLGIFPDTGFQVAFSTASASGSASATFSGGGWALKASSQYAAYYPFNYDYRKSDNIPISYAGQEQKGNKNTDLAGRYDFLAAKATTPTNGAVDFTLQRLGRFIILKFNVPEPTTLTSVKLIAPDDVFTIKGYISLWQESLSITPTETSSSLTVDLDITTTTANEEVTVYFFVAPVDLSGKTLTIEATDKDGNKILSTVAGKDLTDSKAYSLTGTPLTEINVEEAGTLSSYISDDEKYSITSLKISGELNGTDIRFIREMIGRDINGEATEGVLSILDIHKASIVSGGEAYINLNSTDYNTENNKIGANMFYKCDNLIHIILPENITSIDKSAFYECSQMTNIEIPQTVKSIGAYGFYCCTKLSDIELPSSMDEIGQRAFLGCKKLSYIKLSNGLTAINDATFSGCTKLSSVKLPTTLNSIGGSAFRYCESLIKVEIPAAVNFIGNDAFSGCKALSECYCNATTPPTLYSTASFYNIKENATLYVPVGCETTYKSSYWANFFNNIIEMD